jgi:hypothetical protein
MTPKQFSNINDVILEKATSYIKKIAKWFNGNVYIEDVYEDGVAFMYETTCMGNHERDFIVISYMALGIDIEQLLASSSSLEETIDNGSHPMGKT